MPPKPLALIGVPLDLGARNLGVSAGPKAFRDNQIINKLSGVGLQLADLGDVVPTDRNSLDPGDARMRYLPEILRVSNELAARAEEAVNNGSRPLVLGGDHSVCLGAVAGAADAYNRNLGLIYLDAHGDLNTPETTPTGNIHGMHLASLIGLGAPELIDVHQAGAKLAPQNLLLAGGSDFDQPEIQLINQYKIPTFTLLNLLTHGLSPLFNMIDQLASRVENIWVSLDLDCIDQLYAPAAGMPNAKGLSYREISAITEYIGSRCNVVGIDVVEYSPEHDVDNRTGELAIELIANFFGKKYSWYTNYLKNNQL